MKLVESKQNWKGSFSYRDGYDQIETFREVSFTLDLVRDGNSFSGGHLDSESESIFDSPAVVKGFFDRNMISFIVKYPYTYFRDQDGSLIADPTEPHPDIHYLGQLNAAGNYVTGTWEMHFVVEELPEGDLIETLNGGFEMSRIG